MKTILILLMIIISSGTLVSKVPETGIEQIERYIKSEDDTLYIINFWASWCKPCIKEIPYFEEIQKKYSDQKVQVILVSLDMPRHLESRVIPFVENNQIISRVYLLNEPNENKWIPKIDPSWSGAIPATLFIKNREERSFYEKEFSREELLSIVEELLK